MSDWLRNPFANRKARDTILAAKEHGHASIWFTSHSDWKSEILQSIKYYITLLSTRKFVGVHEQNKMRSASLPNPTWEQIRTKVQSKLGDRGADLASKGFNDHGKLNFMADEEVIVTAVAHALTSKCDTAILTRDRDPLEQFRKLMYLIDTDYRSSRVAESFLETPENLIQHPYDDTKSDVAFEPGPRLILDLPKNYLDWIVCRDSPSVGITCYRFGGEAPNMKLARLKYIAPGDVSKILATKGKTGGKNTELLGDRNIHITIAPPFEPEMMGKAIICKDKIIDYGPFRGPVLDLEYALQEVQRFRKRVLDHTVTPIAGGTPGMKLADFFLPKRLAMSSEPRWDTLHHDELALGLKFFNKSALFFLDRDVIPFVPEVCLDALLTKRLSWSKIINDSTLTDSRLSALPSEIKKRLSSTITFTEEDLSPKELGFGYYHALLSLRRQFADVIRNRIQREYSRDCDDLESKP